MIGDIFQPTHLIFIFVVALLVLGPKRLPEVGRSLGKGIRDFRGAMAGIEDQAHGVFDTSEPTSTEPAPAAELAAPAPPAKPLSSFDSAPEDSSVAPVEASSPAASEAAPVAESAPVASQAVPVAATPNVTGSGSGSHEPHPDDYAD